MARWACDDDGWRSDRHYDAARDSYCADVRECYGAEYAEILDALRADETGAAWGPALVAIAKLADRIDYMGETEFSAEEGASIIESMIEGDL